MRLPLKRPLRYILLITYVFAVFFPVRECLCAVASEIPVEAAIYHVHRPGGSHKTYLDVVIGGSFAGKLPDDIDAITVTGPDGVLPVNRKDFKYNPQWRAFWVVLPGRPVLGTYTFKLRSEEAVGIATDSQYVVRTIPIPDAAQFTPAGTETDTCRTIHFSWPLIDYPRPMYYQLQIRDADRRHVYQSEYIREASFLRIPPDLLHPGVDYQWRVRVADGANWISLDNRSHSKWVKYTYNSVQQDCRYEYVVPTQTDDGWQTSSLAKEGIESKKIDALIRGVLNNDIPEIHSVLIVKNGKLVLEEYFHGYARRLSHPLMSVSKSITSILIGIAMDQKKIASTNLPMIGFFPSYPDIARQELKKNIQLRHVLTMTAGLKWNTWTYPDGDMRDSTSAMWHSDDWIRYVLEKEVVEPPGERYVYSNGCTMLLGEILRNATGMAADRYAEKHLFAPLGIDHYHWHKLPDGVVNTMGGLRLSPRDMAKIGYMMLKGGRWEGRQVVSTEWVEESTRAHVQEQLLFGSGYGYQWWCGQAAIGTKELDVFYAAGRGGQYIFVCPALDLVVAITSKWDNDSMGETRPQIIMTQSILPAMLPVPGPHKAKPNHPAMANHLLGDYVADIMQFPVTVFSKGDRLYFRGPDQEEEELFAETKTRFLGTSEDIGEFQVEFFKDQKGAISHFVVQVGFGFWRFNKISK